MSAVAEFNSYEEFKKNSTGFVYSVGSESQFRHGWVADDFSAAIYELEKDNYFIYVGVPHQLEYARIIAAATELGFAPTLMTLPKDLAERLGFNNGREFFWMLRNQPFPPRLWPAGAQVVTDNEFDKEIESFLRAHAPDSAVWPGNPEIDFWITLRDPHNNLTAVAAGVTWQSGEKVLNSVSVATNLRRQGLGALVTLLAGQQHFAAGATRVALGVRASNRGALAMYREIGFDDETALINVRLVEQT